MLLHDPVPHQIPHLRERRTLQICVAVAALVPISAGLAGILLGTAMVEGTTAGVSLDSHVRYLSGLLLAIGLGFWSTIPEIERRSGRFRLLTALVFIGGLARLSGILAAGIPSRAMLGGLVMELVVTPLLCAWQARVINA